MNRYESPKKSFTLEEIKDKMGHFCLYQDRCFWEIEQKLREFDLIPEAKEEVISKLYQYGFINEERFANQYVRGKFNQKKWGKNRLRMELKKRQIPEKMILEAFRSEIDQDDYYTTLEKLAEKKYLSLEKEKESYKKQQKIRSYLAYKGYEFDLIQEVVARLFEKK